MSLTPSEVRIVLTGAMLAMFLSALDQTIVATALPAIAKDFGDFSLISWVVTAYLLTSTCAAPIAGKLSDLYGRRRIMAICLIGFVAGSVLCATATSMVWLIVARAFQGIGGGGLITLSQTIIGDVVAPRERGRYQALFSAMWGSAGFLGPVLGGFLTQYWGWPWIFWINIPLGVAAFVITDRVLRKLHIEPRKAKIDATSIGLLCLSTAALLLFLSLGGHQFRWSDWGSLTLAALAIVLGWLFFRQQGRVPEAILPPRFWKDRVVGPMLAANTFLPGGQLALGVLTPIYFQVALGAPVTQAGMAMVPILMTSMGTSILGGRYARWSGKAKLPCLIGQPITITLLLIVGTYADALPLWAASLMLAAAAGGIGPIYPTSMVAAQNAVQPRDMGAVSGAVTFARTLGCAVAVAAASALLLGLVAAGLPDSGPIASLEDLASRELTPEARAVVSHSFKWLYYAMAANFAIGLAVFASAEDRVLSSKMGGG